MCSSFGRTHLYCWMLSAHRGAGLATRYSANARWEKALQPPESFYLPARHPVITTEQRSSTHFESACLELCSVASVAAKWSRQVNIVWCAPKMSLIWG